MNSLREIARGIIADMETAKQECDPVAARHFQRMSVLAYSDFLRYSPSRTQAVNQQYLAEAAVYRHRAIALGALDEKIEESFERLRNFWLPRLGKERTHA